MLPQVCKPVPLQVGAYAHMMVLRHQQLMHAWTTCVYPDFCIHNNKGCSQGTTTSNPELTRYLGIPPKFGHMVPAAPQAVASLDDAGGVVQAAVAQPRRLQVSAVPLHSLQLLLQVLVLRGCRSQLGLEDSLRQQHML